MDSLETKLDFILEVLQSTRADMGGIMANMATKDDFEGLNAIIRDCTAKLEAAGEDAGLHCQAFAEMRAELADYARRLGPRES